MQTLHLACASHHSPTSRPPCKAIRPTKAILAPCFLALLQDKTDGLDGSRQIKLMHDAMRTMKKEMRRMDVRMGVARHLLAQKQRERLGRMGAVEAAGGLGDDEDAGGIG